jgi:hypothetical protein
MVEFASFVGSPIFIGVLAAAALMVGLATLTATVGVPFVVYRLQRRRKSLAYSGTAAPLATVRSEVRGRVQVLVNGKPVENASVLTLRFRNNGNQVIGVDDFEAPIQIRFPTAVSVLEPSAGEVEPWDLNLQVTPTDDGALVAPLLLNPGDRFDIMFLLDGSAATKPSVSARVAGVGQLGQEEAPEARAAEAEQRSQIARAATSALLGMIAAGGIATLVASQARSNQKAPHASTSSRNSDPVSTGCVHSGLVLAQTMMRASGETVGKLLLMRSSPCRTEWAEVRWVPLPNVSLILATETPGSPGGVTTSHKTATARAPSGDTAGVGLVQRPSDPAYGPMQPLGPSCQVALVVLLSQTTEHLLSSSKTDCRR